MIVAQIIIYKYNNRNNAYVGDRNCFEKKDIFNSEDIKKEILLALKRFFYGYVLVKYAGRMFLCENNNVDSKKSYIRHEIKYHPLEKFFTV